MVLHKWKIQKNLNWERRIKCAKHPPFSGRKLDMEEEWIAGKHSVTEALRSGRTINKIWIADNAQKHLTLPITAEAKKSGDHCFTGG